MFFERRTQSSIKHRRLRYLLLFALRTALVVMLAIAFAHPFIRRNMPILPTGAALKIIAIDNSFSMRAGDRMARAKSEAARLAGTGRAQVLSFGSQVNLLGDATEDAGALRAAIQTVQPGDTRGSYAELSRAVRSIAQSAKVPVELHLIGDLQASGMPANFADLRLGDGVRLIPHPVDKPAGNWTVESVRAPRRVYGAGKVKVLAVVSGFGTARSTRQASLVLNGRVLESRPIETPEGGRATVEFQAVEMPFGMNRGEVRIDGADVLPHDDACYFSSQSARAHLFPRRARGALRGRFPD
jgi:hypothetical protein